MCVCVCVCVRVRVCVCVCDPCVQACCDHMCVLLKLSTADEDPSQILAQRMGKLPTRG